MRKQHDGTELTLHPRQLIGRSPSCDLRLESRSASQEHAVLWWENDWWLKDLGSRNGTRVDGSRLVAGQPTRLANGACLQFGTDEVWHLTSTAPPATLAFPIDGGPPIEAVDGILALPDGDACNIVLYCRADGQWLLEQDDEQRLIHDRDLLTVTGRTYRVSLPEPVTATDESSVPPLRLPDVELIFRVDPRMQHIAMVVATEHRTAELPPRSHMTPLLLLARARMRDAADDVREPERGWLEREYLCRQLSTDRVALNVTLHRARQQLASAGVENVHALVERRDAGAELRLAVAHLTEQPIAS